MDELVPLFGIMIPLTAIVLGIGLAFWSTYWNHQKQQLQYRERQLMIEKGLTPPPILLEQRHRTTPDASLRRGILLLSLGIGLALAAFYLSTFDGNVRPMRGTGVAAMIVGSLGVGNLVYYFIARQKPEDTARPL